MAFPRSPNGLKLQRKSGQVLQANSKVAKDVLPFSTHAGKETDLRNPGQTGKSQSRFRWCWSRYVARRDGRRAWENPCKEMGFTYPQRSCPLRAREQAPPQRSEPPHPLCLKGAFTLCCSLVQQVSTPGPARTRSHRYVTAHAVPAPWQPWHSLEDLAAGSPRQPSRLTAPCTDAAAYAGPEDHFETPSAQTSQHSPLPLPARLALL